MEGFIQEPSPTPAGSEPGRNPHDPSPPLPATRPEAAELVHRLADFGPQLDRLAVIGESLHELVKQLTEPATIETVILTATVPRRSIDKHATAYSIGVYNPNPITVFLGLGGVIAEPNRRAVTVPRNSLLVLPIGGNQIELGAAAADVAAADAVAYLFLYRTVQTAFFGSLGF